MVRILHQDKALAEFHRVSDNVVVASNQLSWPLSLVASAGPIFPVRGVK